MVDDESASETARESTSSRSGGAFGPNAWLVDDMYEQFRADPSSVSASWREFFADYAGKDPEVPQAAGADGGLSGAVVGAPGSPAASLPVPGVEVGVAPEAQARPGGRAPVRHGRPTGPSEVRAAPSPSDPVTELRGAALRIAANMERSLALPTATSVRTIPAKLLEVNRSLLNQDLLRTTGAKVSFTHLIGYAVLQGLRAVPAMNASFVAPEAGGGGAPGVVRHRTIGLGLAVDVERPDGTRSLLVPVVQDAGSLDFRSFVLAYEEVVRKVHTNKVTPDDFAGATVTLTNPGTIGTVQSVPRLMPGQGVIVGVGALGYPAAFEGADRRSLATMGIGPVVTLTSTYDHRIIQGAESGLFLAHVAQCLVGEHGFYEEVFQSLGVPVEPVRWQPDDSPVSGEQQRLVKQVHVESLINMYRVRGHLIADLDPLAAEPPALHPELDPTTYGLTLWDLDREWYVNGLAGRDVMTLGKALDVLRDGYCRTLAIEYMHIQDPHQKRWIQQHIEGVSAALGAEEQRHVLDRLNAAEAFERFLHTRYIGQKRFGLEGAESAIVLLDAVLDEGATYGIVEAVIGMAHRGRLNVLANIVGKSYGEIFREFEGDLDPDSVQGSGDVKYHKGATGKFVSRSGHEIRLNLASNPSHLEAVDPVVEGMARAKQDQLPEADRFAVLPVLLHGDAAFAGQGVVAETLELSQLFGYRTGGTIHLVINNQLGFTTLPESARSSVYPTDVAKMVQAPIFHVNGDDPEACVHAGRLALAFREAFRKDVVIDLVCYRRHGHNEGDDPSYTQPKMYRIIESKRSVRKLYTETLVRRGDITLAEAERALDDFGARLQTALDETRQSVPPQPVALSAPVVPELAPMPSTGVDRTVLARLAAAASAVPDGFTVHPKLARQFEQRAAMLEGGEVDWALGEALAIGSLLEEGTDVRLAGQDTRRGTFSQRHAVLVDYETGDEWVPLAHLGSRGPAEIAGGGLGDPAAVATPRPGRFDIHDSLLSEYAAVGFEYGYSTEAPDALVCWEAQFGDFSNGAQVVIDNFLVAAEDKWGQPCGLALLLPHGYEGQGPEHSSARIERFLTLCARNNLRVAQPTTAAQYFHLLRSQVRTQRRLPLVVFTPKSLLRSRQARSALDQLAGGTWSPVLDDPMVGAQGPVAAAPGAGPGAGAGQGATIDPSGVRRVVLCSGKVAYEAMAQRERLRSEPGGGGSLDPGAIAVIRLEQLYPWPDAELLAVLDRYRSADQVFWLQEEPENMGPWSFVHGRLHRLLRDRFELRHVSRPESASPATGSAALHQLEAEDLFRRVFT